VFFTYKFEFDFEFIANAHYALVIWCENDM